MRCACMGHQVDAPPLVTDDRTAEAEAQAMATEQQQLDAMVGSIQAFMERLSGLDGVEALGRYVRPRGAVAPLC